MSSRKLGDIVSTVQKQAAPAATSQHGSTKIVGKPIIRFKDRPQVPVENNIAAMEAKATRIRSVLLERRPKKSYKWVTIEGPELDQRQVEVVEWSEVDDAQRLYLQEAEKAVPTDFIVDMLERLAMHKRMHNDENEQVTRFVDYANMLAGCTEYALILGVCALMRNESDWFPSFGKVKLAIAEWEVPKYAAGIPAETKKT